MNPAERKGNKAIYSVPSVEMLTEEFVGNFKWPEGTEIAIFHPEKPISGELSALAGLSEKHSLWIAYTAAASDLQLNRADVENAGDLTVSSLPDTSELRELFIESRDDYYHSINKIMTEWQIRQRESFIKYQLPDSRRICVQKHGKAIALLMLTKSKDLQGAPVDWVPWVWISRTITAGERCYVRRCFGKWIKEQVSEKIQCVVSAYNLRSQRFFKDLGFHPECVHLIKQK